MFQVGQKWYGLNSMELAPLGESWKFRDSTDIDSFLQVLEVESVKGDEAVCVPHRSRKKPGSGITLKVTNGNVLAYDFAFHSGNFFIVFSSIEELKSYCEARELVGKNSEQIMKAIRLCKDGDKIKQIMSLLGL